MDERQQLEEQMKILSQTTAVTCEKCSNHTFDQVNLLRHLSKLVSPNGQEALIPIPTFACSSCGHINAQFIPSFVRLSDKINHDPNIKSSTLTLEK